MAPVSSLSFDEGKTRSRTSFGRVNNAEEAREGGEQGMVGRGDAGHRPASRICILHYVQAPLAYMHRYGRTFAGKQSGSRATVEAELFLYGLPTGYADSDRAYRPSDPRFNADSPFGIFN